MNPLKKLVLIPVLVGVITFLVTMPAAQAGQVQSFRPVTTFAVPGGGVAEIVAANPAGDTLVYTNSSDKNVGILDFSDPFVPRQVTTVTMPGEPTSVAITPDGALALVVVQTAVLEEGEKPELKDAQLVVVDLQSYDIVASIALAPGPDSIAIGTVGEQVMAAIAIENEPVIVDDDGKLLDEEDPGNPGDISAPGFIQIVTIDLANPQASSVQDVTFAEDALAEAGLLFPADPQPEFVDIRQGKAAVTLQENNGLAVIDLASGTVEQVFSLGKVADRPADLTEDDRISFTETYPADVVDEEPNAGIRVSDAVAWNSAGTVLYTADEGEMNFTGGRGWSAWKPTGEFVWDDGGALEQKAVTFSYYPEGRSENKGIEVEGVETGVFGEREFAFVGSERGSFVAIYDINDPVSPQFIQILATGIGPEGLLAIPARNLFITSDEESGTLTIFQAIDGLYQPSSMKPQMQSAGVQAPWAALSGLACDPDEEMVLYAVPDNALPSSIYRIEVKDDGSALVSEFAKITENGEQMRFDLEGIVCDTSILAPENPGFWLANEGNAKYGKDDYMPNMLIQVDAAGNVLKRVMLPAEVDAPQGGLIRSNGFEGVTISSDGRFLLAAIQRGYADDEDVDGRKYTRIGRYDLTEERWECFLYPLEETRVKGDWIGLSEIVNLGFDRYAVIERDKQVGGAIHLKAVYTFMLDGVEPFSGLLKADSDLEGAAITKELLLDLRQEMAPFEKLEGLAVSKSGQIWAALDNDGGEVKSVLVAVGMVQDVVKQLAE